MPTDYYHLLGVDKNASEEEIKKAFRKKAHVLHPDKGTGDEAKFKEVNVAYQVLSDPEKRKQYDQFGTTFDQAGAGGASGFDPFSGFGDGQGGVHVDFDNLGDIFGDFFGGSRRRQQREQKGNDIEMAFHVSFRDAVFGTEQEVSLRKPIACEACSGSGTDRSSTIKKCAECNGEGAVIEARQTILGTMQARRTCVACSGEGSIPEKLCSTCEGEGRLNELVTLRVRIPAGINTGETIKLTSQGEQGRRGRPTGDLYLHMQVEQDDFFERDGNTVFTRESISYSLAALGGKIEVQTLDGKGYLKIPAGTQPEKVFVLKGKGVPYLHKQGRGDHHVTVAVTVPHKLSATEKKLLTDLAAERGEKMDVKKGLWERISKSDA